RRDRVQARRRFRSGEARRVCLRKGRTMVTVLPLLLSIALQGAPRCPLPEMKEGDFVLKDFSFNSGEKLPELRMHYRTYGTLKKDARGVVTNAVLVMHGTGGTGGQFTACGFAGELFNPGQPLDAATHFIVMPDDIGHGKSSK